MRYRTSFLAFGVGAALAALLATDPDDNKATTLVMLTGFVSGLIAVGAAHLTRKALLDYPDADMSALFSKARASPEGAGLALMAIAILLVGLLLVFSGRVHATGLPAGAVKFAPILKSEQMRFWPDHPRPAVLAGLVEQETCPTLVHRDCWSPTAQLRSAREEGAGLGQITRAYDTTGAVRFDALTDLRGRYQTMGDLTWSNVYRRPDLQLRAVVLMSRDAYRRYRPVAADSDAALAFADAAYNGGTGGVSSDRRACAVRKNCDPSRWFGHVENTCTKSKASIYGNRSPCDINRWHVHQVLRVRSDKYAALMQ